MSDGVRGLPFEQEVETYSPTNVNDFIAYSVDKKVGEAKVEDFVAICDAENELVALVPPKIAPQIKHFLNNFQEYRSS